MKVVLSSWCYTSLIIVLTIKRCVDIEHLGYLFYVPLLVNCCLVIERFRYQLNKCSLIVLAQLLLHSLFCTGEMTKSNSCPISASLNTLAASGLAMTIISSPPGVAAPNGSP